MKTQYIVVLKNGSVGVYDSFGDALKALIDSGGGKIFRGELIASLSPDEVVELIGLFSEGQEPVEAPTAKGTSREERLSIVIDQMYKGFFTNVLSREFPEAEIHEIVGRGIEKPVKIGNVVKQPARDDFDILNLLEDLARKGYRVVFFTGDKKLATQAELIREVHVVYAPPNEFPGKESLAKYMVEKIREYYK